MPNGKICAPELLSPSSSRLLGTVGGRNLHDSVKSRTLPQTRTHLPIDTIFVAIFLFVGALPARAEQAGKAMVVSESALASEAGLAILKQGGNAIDAATATALAVGVTNPASCGIGGGGFMLIYIAKEGKFYALDYRETAPHAASADMYYRDGQARTRNSRRSARSRSPCRARSRASTRR